MERNFAKNPRTLFEALTIIHNKFKAGHLVKLFYHHPNNQKLTCPIGALLTQPQLDDLRKRDLNDKRIDFVNVRIGTNNIKAMTGMNIRQLKAIQSAMDDSNSKGSAGLANLITKLNHIYIRHKLNPNQLRHRFTFGGVQFDVHLPKKVAQ